MLESETVFQENKRETFRKLLRVCALVFAALVFAALVFAPVTLAQVAAQNNSAPLVILTDAQNEYPLESKLELLHDSSGQLTLQDVMAPPQSNRFVFGHERILGSSFKDETLWLRFTVRNQSSRNDWLLSFFDPRIPYLDVYRPLADGSGYTTKRTGSYLPFDTHEIPDPKFLFQLSIPQDTAQTIYVRVESDSPVTLRIEIIDAFALGESYRDWYLTLGLFYGAMLIMAGYNLFLFVSLRDRTFLYLTILILGLALSRATNDGLGQKYLYPFAPNRYADEYSLLLARIAAILFTTRFLDLKMRAPTLDRIFIFLLGFTLVLMLLVPFANLAPLISVSMAVNLTLLLLAGFVVWHRGYRPARLYLAAALPTMLSAFVFMLYNFGFVPIEFLSDRIFSIGLVALALLWSLALADRIKLMRAETQTANRMLARSERQYHSLFQESHDAVFIITREGEIVDLNPAGLNLFGYTHAELASLNARDLFSVADDYARLQETLDERGFVADYEARMRCKDASALTVLVTSTRWRDEEHGLFGYQGILRDVTERRRAQEELATYRLNLEELVAARTTQANVELAERRRAEAALEQRIQELSTLNEIAKTIGAVTALVPALELVAKHVTQLFEVASTVIAEIDNNSRTARLLAEYPRPLDAAPPLGSTFSFESVPLLEQIANSTQPLEIRDAQHNPHFGQVHPLMQQFEVTHLLLVPLRVTGITNGVMVLISTRAEPFVTNHVLNLAETIGGSIATAIENARLYQQAQATAVADERQRLARELHDSVTQLLYSIVLLAGGWSLEAEQSDVGANRVSQSFNELAELAQQALGEMRLLLYQLRSPLLTEIGLSGALQQRLNAVEHRVGIETQLHASGDLETLPLHVQAELYYIIQEALNNSLRHARASYVQVYLTKQNQHLELSVQDNGFGFTPTEFSEGMGLRNMYARALLIGGNLEILSAQGEGTRVQLRLELDSHSTE